LIKNDAIIDVAMSQVTERDSVIAVRTVIAAGADPSRVLLLPIAHGWCHAMEEAMTAGAELSIALSYAIKCDARKTITDLLLWGADGGAALRSAVDNGRLDDAKRLLEAGLETHAIAKQAAEQGNIKLIQWLVSEKVYLSDVMAELAEESNEQAVKVLVKAGCDASDVLMEVVRSGRHLGAIRTLIDARADTVDALIEVAERGDIKLAKLLIEAGANTVFALMHAMMADNTKIAAVLTAAGADIATAIRVIPRRNLEAKRAFFEAARQEVIAASQGVDESDNQELVGIILAERFKAAERAAKGHTESTRRRVIEKMVIDGQAEDLALLHAIDKLEWGVLKSLLDSGIDGSDLLHFSIERDDVFAVRLLMDAGVSVGVAGALEYVAEFESWTKLNTLLKAGIDPTETFIWLVEQGHFSMAKRMIVELKINTYETFDYLYLVNETYLLKSCLALVTDGHSVVTRAARIGDLKFLRAMIEAGADAPAALGLAISSGQVEAAKTLIAEGVDITAAMKSAVTRNRMTHPATFRLLGADLSAVLIHAAQIGNKDVVGDLIGMGVDGSAALRYLDEQGQWTATDLLLTTAEEQGLPI